MANYDNANGFTPISTNARTGKYTASAAITRGDLLAMVSGQVLPYAIGTHDEAVGVAAQDIASAAEGLVYDDPNTIFRGQCSGSYAAASHDGVAVDVEGTTGIMEVNEDATAKRIVRVLRQSPVAGSTETGNYARVAFLVARHKLATQPDDNLSQPTAAAGGKVELYEATANGSSKVTLQAPTAMAGDRTITLADEDYDLAAIKAKTGLITREVAAAGAIVDLYEGTDNGTNRYRLQAPAALAGNRALTLPDADVDLSSWPASAAKLAMLTAADATAAAKIVLAEDTDNGVNTVTLQAPAALAGNRTITLGDEDYDLGAIKAQAALLTVAGAGDGAKLVLAEPTGGGAFAVTIQAPALAADRTITIPDAAVDLTDVNTHTTQIAALGAENTDGHMLVPFLRGLGEAGTWTPSMSGDGLGIVTRTAAAATEEFWIEVPTPARTTASKGIKPTGLVANYSVNGAQLDDVRFELWEKTLSADNAAPTAAVIVGSLDADYDADHDTAVKRGDNTGAPELHRATVTDAAGAAYLGSNEQLMVRVLVDGDAGGAATFVLSGLELLYSETQVDLT